MRRIRRNDAPPRFELTPMLDVVLLILTFFIYCVVLMRYVEVLPVSFTKLNPTGEGASGTMRAITIDRKGDLYFNRERVSLDELDARLAQLKQNQAPGAERAPQVALAMEEAQGAADRGPIYVQVLERVKASGVGLLIVGQPHNRPPTTRPS
jgi:biopolymer transport protein ExbD